MISMTLTVVTSVRFPSTYLNILRKIFLYDFFMIFILFLIFVFLSLFFFSSQTLKTNKNIILRIRRMNNEYINNLTVKRIRKAQKSLKVLFAREKKKAQKNLYIKKTEKDDKHFCSIFLSLKKNT